MRLAELDAVTLDAHGTLLSVADPTGPLRAALAERGVERDAATVRAAFEAEAAYYVPRSHEGRDAASLAALRTECARTFLEAAGAELDPAEFVTAFVASLRFVEEPGARATVALLRRRGLALAVVSNWDVSLPAQLPFAVDAVVTSAEVGTPKPDPAIFLAALVRLGVAPARALHVGDGDADERGALAAGLRFERAPLGEAVARWA